MPSVAEYCRATAASPAIRRAAICARVSAGNVAGSGKPPENVMTSVAPARARMAVISPPPRHAVRRRELARPSLSVPGPAPVAAVSALLPHHCGHWLDSPPKWKLTLDTGSYKCKNSR